jgi:ferredoxin
MLAFFFAYEAFALWSSPWLTAWLVIGYFVAALAVDVLFPPEPSAATSARSALQLRPGAHLADRHRHRRAAGVRPLPREALPARPRERRRDARARLGGARAARRGARRAGLRPARRGGAKQRPRRFPGCETGLFVPTVTSTMDCTLCLNCVRACPYDNVALRLRSPLREGDHGRLGAPWLDA